MIIGFGSSLRLTRTTRLGGAPSIRDGGEVGPPRAAPITDREDGGRPAAPDEFELVLVVLGRWHANPEEPGGSPVRSLERAGRLLFAGQFFHRHRRAVGQGVTAGNHEHPWLLVQRGGGHLAGGEGQGDTRDQGVDALVGQRTDVATVQMPGGDLGIRVTTTQFSHGVSDHEVFDVADGDASAPGLFTHSQLGLVGSLQQVVGQGKAAGAMKAIQFHEAGGPEVLRYDEVPMPGIGPGEVLVQVHAAGVNPPD